MAKRTQNKGLSNPAVLAAASSPAGQKAMGDITSIAKTNAETSSKIALEIVPFLVKLVVFGGIAYVGYRIYVKRFVKMNLRADLDPANVSDGLADAKANAIYTAMYGFGADMLAVASQLTGLNYNGWVKVYNAFGNRTTTNPLEAKMNLVEWLNDQFEGEEMAQLRLTLPGVF